MKLTLGASAVAASDRPKDLLFLESDDAAEFLEELDLTLLAAGGAVPDVLLEFEGAPPKNPDGAANFNALLEVLGYVTFVVEAYEENGKLYGYWHGPEGTPMKDAAIVSYDSEGTISLESGDSVLEVIVCRASYENEEKFAELKSRLAEHGVTFAAKSWKNYGKARPCQTNPEKLHLKLYEQNGAKA